MPSETHIRILHLEENSSDAERTLSTLQHVNMQVDYKCVATQFEFENELCLFKPDIVLSDSAAGNYSSEQALSTVRNQIAGLPFVLLTSPVCEQFAAKMIKKGASDYLLKSNLVELPKILAEAMKAYEERLRKENHSKYISVQVKKLSALLNNMCDAIMLLDRDGKFIFQSQSVVELTGYTSDEFLSRNFTDFLPPVSHSEGAFFFEHIVQQKGIKQSFTFRFLHKTGLILWAEGTISNMLDDEHIGAVVIHFRDITDRRRQEQQRIRSEAKLQTIFNNTKIAYVLIDREYKVMSFNPLAKERYEKEIGITLYENYPMESYLLNQRDSATSDNFKKVFGGNKIHYEISFDQKTGGKCWYHVDMFPVRAEDGSSIGLLIASEDITARKLADLEKENITADLLHHIKDLEQFAYIVSHNLRSPVANITGLVSLLQDGDALSDVDFKRCLRGLNESATRLDGVITDLNFILQTRKDVEKRKEAVSLVTLLNDIKTGLYTQLDQQNVIITSNFEIEEMFTLRSYLHSILINLIANAIKYRRPDKAPVITITSRKLDNKIELQVSDNGLGIDLERHGNKIFGLYKKFHTHIEGKGMGLYMVKTQVEILGGSISVDSKLNKGSTFTLIFSQD
jgi:PAS domain S-box-containing protein